MYPVYHPLPYLIPLKQSFTGPGVTASPNSPPVSTLHSAGFTGTQPCPAFYVGAAIGNQVLVLTQQALSHHTTLPASSPHFQ